MAFSGIQGLGTPINYYESMVPDFRREALMETQNRLAQQQVSGMQMQNQQAQQEDMRRKEFYGAIQNATPDQLPALRRQFPEFAQNIQQEIGVQGAEHAAFVNGSLNNLAVAMQSGDPNQITRAVQGAGPALSSLGTSPDEVMNMIQSDPQRAMGILNAARLATLPMDKQFDVQQKRDNLNETIRSNQAGEANTRRGQDIQADLGQQRLSLDRDTNRINIENKRLDRQLSVETNDLKKQEIQQRIASNNQQLQQKQQDLNSGYRDSINTLTTSMGTLNDIVTSPALKSITGIRGAIPNVPGSDAADVQARLDTFKSQAFLSAVSAMKGMGALSDAEGKKLDAAVGSLQNSQSEDAFKRNANVIMSMYNQKRNDAVNKYTQQNGIKRVEAPSASIEYLKSHPELSADFINRYGYLPKLGG